MMDHLVNWLWSLQILDGLTLTPETLEEISNGVRGLLEETTLRDEVSGEEYVSIEGAIRDAEWSEALRLIYQTGSA